MRTLLLDSTFFPVRIISWQKAMILLLTGRAEVVTEYDDKQIRSTTQSFTLPKILRLHNKHHKRRQVKFTRLNIYLRDNYTCQYCYKSFKFAELTFDHVHPVSKGGQTTWENIVTCCKKCNSQKGAKLLAETNFKLLNTPKTPNWSATMCLRIKENDPIEWFNWLPN
ncbi:HNH endonuclease [Halobacteriovorax sp. HLS]|uniref:HNH endonuclease n=1 Tax=Halobacteriovorax sp. HLS TaxID=2234000 RepID=UPI000FD9C6C6